MKTLYLVLLFLFGTSTLALAIRFVEDHHLSNYRKNYFHQFNLNCGQSYKTSKRNKHRINKGRNANPGEFPHQVYLTIGVKNEQDDFINNIDCGGTLIDEWHILTAAHCLKHCGGTTIHVMASIGDRSLGNFNDGGVWVDTSKAIIHRGFKPCSNSMFNMASQTDIALVKMREPITFEVLQGGFGSKNRICMPGKKGIEKDFDGTEVEITGWGLTKIPKSEEEAKASLPDVLQAGVMNQVDVEFCNTKLKKVMADKMSEEQIKQISDPEWKLDSERHICLAPVKGSTSLAGDSGGSAVRRKGGKVLYLFGILSFGIEKEMGKEDEMYSVYTRVSHYLDWIESAKRRLKSIKD